MMFVWQEGEGKMFCKIKFSASYPFFVHNQEQKKKELYEVMVNIPGTKC